MLTPLREAIELEAGSAVRARVRTAPARSIGTWTSWALKIEDSECDEQSVWTDIEEP